MTEVVCTFVKNETIDQSPQSIRRVSDCSFLDAATQSLQFRKHQFDRIERRDCRVADRSVSRHMIQWRRERLLACASRNDNVAAA